jgi:iron(III) transport system permease protein
VYASRVEAAAPARRASRWRRGLSWQVGAIALLLLVLLWLTVSPVAILVWGSVRDAAPGLPGTYTLDNYWRAYGDGWIYRAAWNSVMFAFGSSLVAFAIGAFLAWVTERTNTPGKPIIYALALFPVIMPGILSTISWALILHPTIGLVNRLAALWFGIEGPLVNAYTMPGMIWIHGADHISLPFLLMAAAFRGMDPALEEASLASGGSLLYTLRTVTLPLLTPSVLATFMLLFIRGVESFETPAIIGIPAQIPVFATAVWLAIRSVPSEFNLAAAYAMGYLAITLGALWLYFKATGLTERFATITGKGYRPVPMDLGRAKWPVTLAAFVTLAVVVVLPLLVVLWTSFVPFYQVPSARALERLTLDNYGWILGVDLTAMALRNNLIVGISSALAAVFLAAVISWVVIRSRMPGRGLLDVVAFAPIAFPGTLFGLALLWFYLTVPLPIYGTLWVLVLGFVASFIPLATRATHAALTQLHPELEEASAASGASWGRTFVQIIVPLIIPALLVSFIYILSLTFKVLSLPVMLTGPGTALLPVLIFELSEGAFYPRLCALGILMILTLVLLSGISRAVAGRFGVQPMRAD